MDRSNNRQGAGGFGSTQATILALKALVEHAKANRKTLTAGKLIVRRDDMPIGEQAFDAGQQETIPSTAWKPSSSRASNRLNINLTRREQDALRAGRQLSARCKPESDAKCPVRLDDAALAKTARQGGRDGRA